MTIENTLILKLESLAKLQLEPKEREQLRNSLNHILTMVEQLNEVDTEGVSPLVYVSEDNTPPRADEVRHQLDRTKVLQNAPESNDAFFKVPKVLDI
ncbi:MAG: hypothetical protein RL757_1790 [Bacteroidota bacterium]|jgi:aspartyl-tRNA(Asn)/glutamyl-tRNA(Gln) amidotransferase subunit C